MGTFTVKGAIEVVKIAFTLLWKSPLIVFNELFIHDL